MKALIFDLETTGTDKSKDRVIEFGGILIDWDVLQSLPITATKKDLFGKAEKVYQRYFLPDDGTEVTVGAYAKTGMTRETLKGCPSFGSFADECEQLINEVDVIITFNGMVFDIPFLTAEMARYGKNIDWAKKKFFDTYMTEITRNSNKLNAVFERQTGVTMEEYGLGVHEGLSDVIATTMVFNAQNAQEMQPERQFVTDDGFLTVQEWMGVNTVCFNQGKYHGIPLREVIKSDMGYIEWVLGASFSTRTKDVIRRCIEYVKKTREDNSKECA